MIEVMPLYMYTRRLLCNFVMEGGELEECGYLHLHDSTHLLQAVVHANGYGHLLWVNGHEGGSRILSDRDIMSFWDRLCKVLHLRKVTVMDISKKHGMDYMLLTSKIIRQSLLRTHRTQDCQGIQSRPIFAEQ